MGMSANPPPPTEVAPGLQRPGRSGPLVLGYPSHRRPSATARPQLGGLRLSAQRPLPVVVAEGPQDDRSPLSRRARAGATRATTRSAGGLVPVCRCFDRGAWNRADPVHRRLGAGGRNRPRGPVGAAVHRRRGLTALEPSRALVRPPSIVRVTTENARGHLRDAASRAPRRSVPSGAAPRNEPPGGGRSCGFSLIGSRSQDSRAGVMNQTVVLDSRSLVGFAVADG